MSSSRRRERSSTPPRGPSSHYRSPPLPRREADRRYDSERRESRDTDRVRDRQSEDTSRRQSSILESDHNRGSIRPPPLQQPRAAVDRKDAGTWPVVQPTPRNVSMPDSPKNETASAESSKKEFVDLLKTYGDRVADRATQLNERKSANKILSIRVEEYNKMEPQFPKFPQHQALQTKSKQDAEEAYRLSDEKYERSNSLYLEAVELLATRLAQVQATPASSDKVSQRVEYLDTKVNAVEKATEKLASNLKLEAVSKLLDEKRRNQDEFSKLLPRLNTLEERVKSKEKTCSELLGLQKKSESDLATTKNDHAKLSKRVEERDRANVKDFERIKSRLDTHNQRYTDLGSLNQDITALQKDLERESTARLELYKKSEETSKQIIDIPKQASDIASINTEVAKIIGNVAELQRALEKPNGVAEMKICVTNLQNSLNDNLEEYRSFKTDIQNLKSRLAQVEKSHTSRTEGIPPLPGQGRASAATMNGIMHTKITNLERDINLIKERLKNVESAPQNTGPKLSPFSTTTQELADTKKDFEMLRSKQDDSEKDTKERLEMFKTRLDLHDATLMSTKDRLTDITERIVHIPQVQQGMNELLDKFNRVADSQDKLNVTINDMQKNQEGTIMAVTHLSNRFASLSSSDLARHMMSQCEALYPNLRTAEGSITELRKLVSAQAPQIEALKSQLTTLNQLARNSPGSADKQETRKELDTLAKDLIHLSALNKRNESKFESLSREVASFEGLKDDVAVLGQKLEGQIQKVMHQDTDVATELAKVHIELDEFKHEFYNSIDHDSTKVLGTTTDNQPVAKLSSRHSSATSSTPSEQTRKKRMHPSTVVDGFSTSKTNGHSSGSRSPIRKKARKGGKESLDEFEESKRMFERDDEED